MSIRILTFCVKILRNFNNKSIASIANKTNYDVFNIISLGYGINGMDRVVSNGDLCNKGNDNFDKLKEAVFQMGIGASSNVIKAKQWAQYSDLDTEKAGFICEKEGS